MVMYLLDTVILSEMRKQDKNPGVAAWIGQQRDTELFISVISIGELERGICAVGTKDAPFAERLAAWLDKLIRIYSDRVLPVSLPVARRWGMLSASTRNAGADVMLAATALEHNCTVVTRNVRHFEPLRVNVLNPWS